MALDYIHKKKILHRDIKSSNIFLNANGTLKIGDFGISKVLENTTDQAQTVLGTPYYMSPELCENLPYEAKSDIWALGCILYELCALERAFQADNLWGLVYKIVKETYKPIPKIYSKELGHLVDAILQKSPAKRPSMSQIYGLPIIRQTIGDFVEMSATGRTPLSQKVIPIKRTLTHLIQKKEEKPTQNNNKLTPLMQMRQNKIQAAKLREQQMKDAARGYHITKPIAK